MSQPERSISIYRGDTYEHTVTFVWRDWDEDVAYVVGQHVAYGGHTYVALLGSTGTTPGTDPLTWDDVASVTTIDVSDRTFRSQVRRRRSLTSDLLLTFDVDDSSAADGVIVLSSTGDDTGAIARAGTYRWDLQYSKAGAVVTVMAGPAVVDGEVTADA